MKLDPVGVRSSVEDQFLAGVVRADGRIEARVVQLVAVRDGIG